MSKQIVFISCGQRTSDEKQLGKEIEKLVRELTPFEPYFAEYQHSFHGLITNIFGNLNNAAGIIAVMHRRGRVQFLDDQGNVQQEIVRASVWIEQEIAIAAFLTHISGRDLYVQAFAESGIAREGVRDQLQLNPITFTNSTEVLEQLRQELPNWKPTHQPSEVELELRSRMMARDDVTERHCLQILARNLSNRVINKYWVELDLPHQLMIPGQSYSALVQERTTATHAFFRVTHQNTGRPLYPGDPLCVFSLDYLIREDFFVIQPGVLTAPIGARFFADGITSPEVERNTNQLRQFMPSKPTVPIGS